MNNDERNGSFTQRKVFRSLEAFSFTYHVTISCCHLWYRCEIGKAGMYWIYHSLMKISYFTRLIFCRERLDHRMKIKLSMCRVGVLTIFYSPQLTMKRVWNALLPKIYVSEQCKSLCKRQIFFENPPEPTLGFDRQSDKLNTISFSVTCLLIHHVMSW